MAHEPTLRGRKVTVLGLGIEGIDLVHFLTAEGAAVTASDRRGADQLRDALAAIAGDDPTLSLDGEQDEAIEAADAVFVSQGVPWRMPALERARTRGATVSSMTGLFFERCPAPIAGITGSAGKTTTTALVGAMLEAGERDHVVGGNIGVGLLGLLERVTLETSVVAELSHTQLESLERSPQLACVTNVTPNHLDDFSWEEYVALKRRIFAFQSTGDTAIFNLDDAICAAFAAEAPAAVAFTSIHGEPSGDSVTIDGDSIVRREAGVSKQVAAREQVLLRGEHNLANVLSAVAVATRLGVADDAIAQAIADFRGVPHRLEPVLTARGVQWVNDSIATSPERTLAGMRSFDEPLVLLLGGRDKQLPLDQIAREVVARCRAVITFGEAGERYAAAVHDAAAGGPPVDRVDDVEAAVEAAARVAKSGDVVLFSPIGASFDAYSNFERRGVAFRAAVRAVAGER